MYCAINEAYNGEEETSRLADHPINNKNNNQIMMPDSDPEIYPAFFTAQGDYSTQGPYYGTTINELKDGGVNDMDSFSLPDSEYTNESLILKDSKKSNKKKEKTKTKVIDHEYYIDKTIKSLLEDQDSHSLSSLASSQNNYVYQHVKSCKYCKSKINEKMKEHFQPEIKKEKNKDTVEYFDMNNLGYDLKEIFIIILAGVVLVFILDLLVKIGKRMK